MAFMTGKLKVRGDMALAMKLQNLLRSRCQTGTRRISIHPCRSRSDRTALRFDYDGPSAPSSSNG